MIALKGQTEFAASAKRARAAMASQPQLVLFLPQGTTVSKRDEESFDFVLSKRIGVTTIKLTGTMTVTSTEDPMVLRLVAQAKHFMGGTVVVDLMLRFTGTDTDCTLAHDGTLETTGFLRKFLPLGEFKLQNRVNLMFVEFGQRQVRSGRAAAV